MQKFKNREEYERWKAARLGPTDGITLQSLKKERPLLCLSISIGFIIFAVLLILNGFNGLLKGIQFQAIDMTPLTEMHDEMPFPFKMVLFVFQHLTGLSLLQIAISVFVLIAAIYFLKMRAWARTTLEAVSWISLVFVASVGLFASFSCTSIVSAINAKAGSTPAPTSFTIFGIVLGLAMTIFFSAVPATAIILLRCATTKKAFAGNCPQYSLDTIKQNE